jgi:hypothetical protein
MFYSRLPGFSFDIYKVLMILPLVISILITPAITKNFFFLKSLALSNDNLLCKVMETADHTDDVLDEVVEIIEGHCSSNKIPLTDLFSEWANSRSKKQVQKVHFVVSLIHGFDCSGTRQLLATTNFGMHWPPWASRCQAPVSKI